MAVPEFSDEVKLKWYNNKRSVELEDYSPSGIWDVIQGSKWAKRG